jgi:uncharacterized protein (TIGR02266 family)
MPVKTILIAHRDAGVRDRFAVALADARHRFVMAESEAAAREAAAQRGRPVNLALLDLTLSDDRLGFVRAIRRGAGEPIPVIVFAGTVASAAEIPLLSEVGGVGYINEHAGTPQILPALAPLLFPDNFNRRSSLRVSLGVPISYRAGPTIAGALTLDVGKGGVGIRTMSPLPKGTAVQLKFRLPGMTSDIDAAGRVAWSDRKVGMGIQFERISPADQRTIDGFIDTQG